MAWKAFYEDFRFFCLMDSSFFVLEAGGDQSG